LISTEIPFYYEDLYIRATTESERYPAYLAINFKVCGNETISVKTKDVVTLVIS